MTLDKHLYIGQMTDKEAGQIIRRIKKNKTCDGVWLVTLPLFQEGMLEIYNINEFSQTYYQKRTRDIHIVGLAPSRQQAFTVVRNIVDDVYSQTGNFDMRSFFDMDR